MSTTILITSLNAFQVDTTGPWDPTWPAQLWHDPNAAKAIADMPSLANVPATYTTWSVDASGDVTTPTFSIPMGRAAVPNIPPANWLVTPGNVIIPSPNNPPIDLTKMPAGYQVQANIGLMAVFSGANAIPQLVPIVATPTPAPAGTDPTLVRILEGVEEELAAEKLPPV